MLHITIIVTIIVMLYGIIWHDQPAKKQDHAEYTEKSKK